MPNDAYEYMKMLLNVNKNAKIVIECELHANVRFLALMNASSRYWSSIHTNECVFSRNEQQKVYLFTIEAEKFSVTHKRPFFLRLKKTNIGVYFRNNLFTSLGEMIDSFLCNQYKPFKANNMKQFNESNL